MAMNEKGKHVRARDAYVPCIRKNSVRVLRMALVTSGLKV